MLTEQMLGDVVVFLECWFFSVLNTGNCWVFLEQEENIWLSS